MKKQGVLILCTLCIAAGACGLSAGRREKGPDSTADQEELLPLRVAVQEYYVSSPVGYIVEKGLDREYGLELELVMYPSGAEQILDADQDVYDVATIGASFLYPLMEDQAVLIGEHIKSTGADAIYVKPDSPILGVRGFNPIYQEVYGDPETVRGSTILMKENTTSQYLGMKWLESIGVKADAVEIRYMDLDQVLQNFSDGCGDAAVLAAPYSYQAEKDGYVKVASTESLYVDMYEVIIATNKAYEGKTEALERFLEVLLYANRQLEADFGEKLKACGAWYENNGVAFTQDALRKECEDKLFVTEENYSIGQFGEFEYKYAEYMAAIGNIPPASLKNVKENIDSSLFCQAFEQVYERR